MLSGFTGFDKVSNFRERDDRRDAEECVCLSHVAPLPRDKFEILAETLGKRQQQRDTLEEGGRKGGEGSSIIHADGNRFHIHELPAHYALHFRRNTVNGTHRRRYRDYRRNPPPEYTPQQPPQALTARATV